MKLSQFTKPLCATAIALSVGTLSILPASAQNTSGSASGNGSAGSSTLNSTTPGTSGTTSDTTAPGTTTNTTDTTPVDRNDGFDWGWLGLLGLIGLAGLRKHEDTREVYRDPSTDPARTTTRTSDYNR